MKALCQRAGLLEGFGLVAGVASPRSSKPILQNVKLVVREGAGAQLLATDLEMGIRLDVTGVRAEQAGATILPTRRFEQILRTSEDEEDLYLEMEEFQLKVRGGKHQSRFELTTDDPDHFPDVPEFAAEGYYQVAAADLKRLIRRTIFATDPDSSKYALGGVLFELEADKLTLVGTDGRRLARAEAEMESVDAQTPAGQPVVPVKMLRLLERNLGDRTDEPPVHLAFPPEGNAILVRTERAVLYSRLVEGRFPRYRDVFPSTHEARIDIDAGMLRNRVEQAAVIISEESRRVDFSFEAGKLRLSGSSPDVGQSQVELPVEFDGETIRIAFDPKYLLEALRVLDEDARLHIELVNGRSPAVLHTDDKYSYVIMPMTVPDDPV